MARSLRLSRVIRDTIVEDCSFAMFNKREEAFQKSKVAFADAIYENRFGKEEPLVLKLSPQWYRKTNQIIVKVDGFSYSGEATKDASGDRPSNWESVSCYLKMSRERAQPVDWDDELNIGQKHPLYQQAQAIVKERAAIVKAMEEFESKIRQIVYSVDTLAKLKELWPEGKKFFPEEPNGSRALVAPATIAAVNKDLNLP